MFKFSFCLIVKNEEKNIARCLNSIKNLSDDIIIIDSFSTDKTAELAKEQKNVRIYQNPWQGYSKQRNFAHSKAKYDWIFWFDADELISEDLRQELYALNPGPKTAAYKVPRLDIFYGRWIKHGDWYPQYHVNLYNKQMLFWDERMLVHEKLISRSANECETGIIKSPLLHFSHLTVNDTVRGFLNYTDLESIKIFNKKKNKSTLFLIFEMWGEMFKQFFGRYFIRQGFRDGVHGFLIACSMSFYKFLQYSKLIYLKYFFKNKERIAKDIEKYSIDTEYYDDIENKLDKGKSNR